MAKKFTLSIPLVGLAGEKISEYEVAELLENVAEDLRSVADDQNDAWVTQSGVIDGTEHGEWHLRSPSAGIF